MSEPMAKLLVVDDNEMNRDMLSRRLARVGYSVGLAASGHEALAMIESDPYDVILLDIMMPEITGLQVLEILRRQYSVSDLPIIMVTARSESSEVVKALELGANDYVTKPIDFPVILARLETQITLKRLTEMKDQFLRIASHDLKNPLSLVLGAASSLPKVMPVGARMTEDVHDILRRIHHRAVEMKRIIEDFLDFQALSDGGIETCAESMCLNQLAQSVVDGNREYAASKEIGLVFEPHPDLPLILADPARLGQVIQNLVGNAVKFCPAAARVVVRTRIEECCVFLEVRDSGPGLTDTDLDKAFTKYARLSNTPTGGEKSSGLGLYISKLLIDLHGGQIGARNDDGATFWFSLPLAEPQ